MIRIGSFFVEMLGICQQGEYVQVEVKGGREYSVVVEVRRTI